MMDPVDCCEAMGLQTPLSALRLRNSTLSDNGAAAEASLEYLEVLSQILFMFPIVL